MTTLTGSPRSGKLNNFINRYVQSLDNNTGSTPILKPLSSSNMNLSNIANVTSIKEKNSPFSSPFRSYSPENKENNGSLNRSPVLKNLHESTQLQTNSSVKSVDLSGLSSTELKYYEFLCRVGEVKQWIEDLIKEQIPSELELCTGDSLRNGVYLAQITQIINPELAPSIFPAGNKLQFKHTQNITAFFSLVEHVGVPDSFRFELQDLYNKKDLPQVFETLHILITMINRKWSGKTSNIQNLSGQLTFSKEDVRKCQRHWPKIRDFKSLGSTQLSPSPNGNKNAGSPGLIKDFNKYEKPNLVSTSISPPETPTKSMTFSPTRINYDNELIATSPKGLKFNKESPNLFSASSPTNFHYGDNDATTRLESPAPTFKISDTETPQLEYSPLKSMSLSYYSPTISRYLTYDTDFYLRRSENREKDFKCYEPYNYDVNQYSPNKKQKMTEYEFLDQVVKMQSHCRAVNIRFDLFMKKKLLKLFEKDVLKLQSSIRGNQKRTLLNIRTDRDLGDESNVSLIKLQAVVKANNIRYRYDKLRIQCIRSEHHIEKLQTFTKSHVIRKRVQQQLQDNDVSHSMNHLQSMSRGYLIRTRMNALHANIPVHKDIILDFSSKLQGYRVRKMFKAVDRSDKDEATDIIPLQGIVRGILVRYTLDLVDDIIEHNGIDLVQAQIRGSRLRSRMSKSNNYFLGNKTSIVMVQSWIRMHLQRSAYQEILECPNPSLWAVRKFTYLLNDCGTIEDVQNKLENCQASLDAENLKRDNLQKMIREQLDMLGVLEKFGLDKDTMVKSIQDGIDVPASQYPMLEKFFYLIQVNPSYWKTVYLQNPDFVEKNVYLTFTALNQKMNEREKIYFTRFLSEIMQCSITSEKTITSFLDNKDQFWERQLRVFLQREYPELFSVLQPLIEYISNPSIDFESDPYKIYSSIYDIQPRQGVSPIEDPDVKNRFINNLKNIWHCVEIVADLFTRMFLEIPIEVRFLCTKIFGFAADKNADELNSLRTVSKVLIDCFIGEYIQNRSYYGYVDRNYESTDRKARILLETLKTVFEMRQFEGYYDPLNQYCDEIKRHLKNILYNVMIEPDYEQKGDRLIYQDMVSQTPRLEILTEKAKDILETFREYSNDYPDKDIIQDVLKMNTTWKSFPKSGRVLLGLDATVYRFLVSDDQMRKLYDQVKRAIIYMTQIEEVDTNVYDLVVSSVLPGDEPVFAQFLDENPKIKNDPLIKRLESFTYFNLKNITLKKIHELENSGVMSSADNRLQNLLNDIANTVKNPNYAINYVTQELNTTNQTMTLLSKINHRYDENLHNIRRNIQNIMKASQRSRNFVPVHKGTFGNIKSAYKNLQHKDGTELEGLTFKWNTRQLFEKGVIKKIESERLAEQTVKVFGSSGPKYPDIIFKMSTSDGSRFGIQMIDKRKGTEKKHAEVVDSFTFHDLLKSQAGKKTESWNILKSKVTVSTAQLLTLVIDSFFS